MLKEQDGRRQLPIIVGSSEAQSIALALECIDMPRPLTHDLLVNILDQLDAQVNRIVISHMKSGTFYAHIVITGLGKHIRIDSRPSDAIAIGLRAGIPIFVKEKLLELEGVDSLEMENDFAPAVSHKETESPKLTVQQKITNLKTALSKAIEMENYEVAARIRDQLNQFTDKEKAKG